jgi:hypothetical protein
MTTYATIGNGEIDGESPITDTLMSRLRDNPLAMFEGSTGAPRLSGFAVARLNNGLGALTISAADTYALQYGLVQTSGILVTSSGTDQVAHTYQMSHYSGTVRCKASHSSASGTSTLSIYRNGTLLTSFTTTSASPVARVADSFCNAGDVIEWRHRTTGTNSTVSSVSATASDAWVPVFPLIPASAS